MEGQDKSFQKETREVDYDNPGFFAAYSFVSNHHDSPSNQPIKIDHQVCPSNKTIKKTDHQKL